MSVLRDKICLLTGASGGIGRALAFALAAKGAKLLLTARSADALDKVGDQARALGSPFVQTIAADLADRDGLESLAAQARAAGADILINNAGVFPQGSFSQLALSDLEACLAVNLKAPFALARAVSDGMLQRRWGRIVNIGSSSAYMGVAGSSLYCTSKHALLGFSRALHAELREHGVRVYCISPGSVRTAMGDAVQGQDGETFITPEEVADTVVFAMEQDRNLVCDEIRLNRMSYR